MDTGERGAGGDRRAAESGDDDPGWAGGHWRAHSVISKEEVFAYVDSVLNHRASLVTNPVLPIALQRQLYSLVVRVVLHLVHYGLGALHARAMFGRLLTVEQSRSPASDLERCDLNLDPAVVDTIANTAATRKPIVSAQLDRLIYGSTVRFSMRLQ